MSVNNNQYTERPGMEASKESVFASTQRLPLGVLNMTQRIVP